MSENDTGSRVRRHVIFRGRVQGVFFRATSAEIASGYDVVGFVRNLPDGTVELEAEGTSTEVDGLLAAIQKKYAAGITQMIVSGVPTRNDEGDFRITY